MSTANEFETSPVAPNQLQPAKNFAASYSGEHVAGTEFVIGALFVSWGVSTQDLILGLIIGNLFAVLTWGLITAPIATNTRLTLYAYLEKIAGPGTVKLYSVVNGALFAILAGAMITVSASAVRVLFDIPTQQGWYPTDIRFVLIALAVGAVVVTIAMKGFEKVARFAEVCAPWMILMFGVGALALIPTLVDATDGVSSMTSIADFMTVADSKIWIHKPEEGIGMLHVAAFAWVANLAMHGSLGDMTLLRFAKKSKYGYFSALGMFIGHFFAWICAGIMGAGAGILLQRDGLDPGDVASQALGAVGILAVIIAGWTTSNPTIYRAGLAFQSINYKWNRTKVTIVVGVITTIIACSPKVFSGLLGFVGLMGILLAPVGALIVTEHWFFPKIGLTRYWSNYKNNTTNIPAVVTWFAGVGFAILLGEYGLGLLHLFYLLIPVWVFSTVLYIVLAKAMGAGDAYPQAIEAEKVEQARRDAEADYLASGGQINDTRTEKSAIEKMSQIISYASLAACAVIGVGTFTGAFTLDQLRLWLIFPTITYFAAATFAIVKGNSKAA